MLVEDAQVGLSLVGAQHARSQDAEQDAAREHVQQHVRVAVADRAALVAGPLQQGRGRLPAREEVALPVAFDERGMAGASAGWGSAGRPSPCRPRRGGRPARCWCRPRRARRTGRGRRPGCRGRARGRGVALAGAAGSRRRTTQRAFQSTFQPGDVGGAPRRARWPSGRTSMAWGSPVCSVTAGSPSRFSAASRNPAPGSTSAQPPRSAEYRRGGDASRRSGTRSPGRRPRPKAHRPSPSGPRR